MTTTTTAPAACIDPLDTKHEHCPEHGCVEYLCCVPVVPATRATMTIDPAQSWVAAFRTLWPTATAEDMHAAREYIPLMASPEEAVLDLGGPVAKCGDCRRLVRDTDLSYERGGDDWFCTDCASPVNHCRIDGCGGISYHPGGNCPDCNRALARLGFDR